MSERTVTRFVVWHRKERGPISPAFASREAARRYIGEVYRGRPGLEVRRVTLPQAKETKAPPT